MTPAAVRPRTAHAMRLSREQVVGQPTRARILTLLRAEPGASTRRVQAGAGCSLAVTRYHLCTLQASGVVTCVRVGSSSAWFADAPPTMTQRIGLALHVPLRLAVFEYVQAHPGVCKAEVAKALGCSRNSVDWHVRKLRGVDVVFVKPRMWGERGVGLYAREQTLHHYEPQAGSGSR